MARKSTKQEESTPAGLGRGVRPDEAAYFALRDRIYEQKRVNLAHVTEAKKRRADRTMTRAQRAVVRETDSAQEAANRRALQALGQEWIALAAADPARAEAARLRWEKRQAHRDARAAKRAALEKAKEPIPPELRADADDDEWEDAVAGGPPTDEPKEPKP